MISEQAGKPAPVTFLAISYLSFDLRLDNPFMLIIEHIFYYVY